MTTPTPGWYPDPQLSTQMRWWDGQTWTADVYERVEPPGGYLSEGAATSSTATASSATAVQARPAGPVTTTDDGAQLASWRRRVAARLIDAVITTPLILVLCLPLVTDLVQHLGDVLAEQENATTIDPFAIYDTQSLRDLGIIGLVSLIVSLAYEMGFLLWRAATPGKLLLGLRVRRWTPGEHLAASVIARRWIGYQGLGQVLGGLYSIIDGLWPLWDPRRQALHDKLAGTCVVVAPKAAP